MIIKRKNKSHYPPLAADDYNFNMRNYFHVISLSIRNIFSDNPNLHVHYIEDFIENKDVKYSELFAYIETIKKFEILDYYISDFWCTRFYSDGTIRIGPPIILDSDILEKYYNDDPYAREKFIELCKNIISENEENKLII